MAAVCDPVLTVHASTVAVDGTGVLIRGPSGAGKSDLALRLIDEGAVLVADDYTTVSPQDGRVIARPPATITGLIELRGYGIVCLPTLPEAPVALIVDLCPWAEAPRLPEERTDILCGLPVPRAYIDPAQPSATARIRQILTALHRESATAHRSGARA